MNKKAKKAIKPLGGLFVLSGTFLLLILISNFNSVVSSVKYAFNVRDEGAKTTVIPTETSTNPNPAPPQGFIEGFFDTGRPGDFISTNRKDGGEVRNHFRAIYSEQIKTAKKIPVLKLQVYDGSVKKWKTIDISDFDQNSGTVSFLLKTEIGNTIYPEDSFTGSYQLIFN